MSRPIIFGSIEEIEEGFLFQGRKEMMPSSFHRKWAHGIDGNKNDGVAAIVLSGGYEDDEDFGNEIIYTGAGGNEGKKQVEDQTWENTQNAGLLKSMIEGLPIRVIRGSKHKSEFSPLKGYQYAGLYSVVDAWEEKGISGYKVCRFRLEYIGEKVNKKLPETIELSHNTKEKRRVQTSILRIVRDTKIAHDIKKLYNYECQVCGVVLEIKSIRYAEGAHIKPLGKPHDGEDNSNNLLCLCPNHHILFDRGAFSISDSFDLIGDIQGKLKIHEKHNINKENLKYHRKSHGHD
ncbi:MAG TPA: hypothetical protein DEQ26_13115 [Flavobacteriaceae bacterium]|nr:hypothetical protein [Flavobacteriaceae bacterium]